MIAGGPDLVELDSLVAQIPDGAKIALPPEYAGTPTAAAMAIVRRGTKNLHIVGVPTVGFHADLLIGAGAVKTLEAAAASLGEFGMPPRFVAALKFGRLTMRDATCPAIHAALQASEKGIPFMPLRGIIGSDLLTHRDDWKVIDNPLAEGNERDPIVLLPAIRPDFALFHARKADKFGNVWIGVRRELMLMAHASRRTLVTVEEVVDTDFLQDDAYASGTIPALYVHAIAEVRNGSWPVGLPGAYGSDDKAIADYVRAAKTEDGFAAWLAEHVHGKVPA